MKHKHITITLFFLFNTAIAFSQNLFYESFENGLINWQYTDSNIVQLFETQDTLHNTILKLIPNRTSDCLLIKNSDQWDSVMIEGEVLFPTNQHNYLGLVYNYQKRERKDFGCIYIKGNGSYVRVNPHRDGNASRALYEEYKTKLKEDRAIIINKWIPFKAEIIGSEIHFYVKNMSEPVVVFNDLEFSNGMIGFKPRFAGAECWLDNIKVRKIVEFSNSDKYSCKSHVYEKENMLYNWHAIGPFNKRLNEIETANSENSVILDKNNYNWFKFDTDARGCIVAGKICRYTTNEKFAYFSTTISYDKATKANLMFSTLNNLHVWVNSEYLGMVDKQKYAWYDFDTNMDHNGRSIPVIFKKGTNRILILVEGANYSGDGFYSKIKKL